MSSGHQRIKWRRKHCRKFQSAELGARTLQTTDNRQTDDRQTDGRRHNMNMSSRSLKSDEHKLTLKQLTAKKHTCTIWITFLGRAIIHN